VEKKQKTVKTKPESLSVRYKENPEYHSVNAKYKNTMRKGEI